MSLNLIMRVDASAGATARSARVVRKKFGLVGAKVAIDWRTHAPDAPVAARSVRPVPANLPSARSPARGRAKSPLTTAAYLFNFGLLTESNVTDWVEMVKSVGFTQIDNHGGGAFFRFGSMELNRQKWPEGWDSWQRIVARLHEAGIGSIFHSYAFFIDKQSKVRDAGARSAPRRIPHLHAHRAPQRGGDGSRGE